MFVSAFERFDSALVTWMREPCHLFVKSCFQVPTQGLLSTGEILEDIAARAADRRRREKKSKQRAGKLQGIQLELFPDPLVPRDPERPLVDLLPEAYDV